MSGNRATPPARLLVVDDDLRYSEWLRHHLDVLCPQASVSMLNLAEFERWCAGFSGRDCDLLMLAAAFGASPEDPQSQGLSLLRRLREQPATPAVIALAEDGNELTAVRALQLGELGPRLRAELGVEVRQRLVHQEDLGSGHDGPGQRHALALPTRQGRGLAAEVVAQVEHPRGFRHVSSRSARVSLRRGPPSTAYSAPSGARRCSWRR